MKDQLCSLIMVPSITYANKAQLLLRKNRISASITRAPRHLALSGCNYCLRTQTPLQRVIGILKKGKIPVLKTFPCN